jgi:hypothetical protein
MDNPKVWIDGGRFQEPRWAESRRGVDRPGRLEISRRRTPSGGMEGWKGPPGVSL